VRQNETLNLNIEYSDYSAFK